MSFLTLEDINSAIFSNQGFYWHRINTASVSDSIDFSNVKIDFCNVSRTTGSSYITYEFKVENVLWSMGYYLTDSDGNYMEFDVDYASEYSDDTLTIHTHETSIQLHLYMGWESYGDASEMGVILKENELALSLEEIANTHSVKVVSHYGTEYDSDSLNLVVGYNPVTYTVDGEVDCGFLLVKLIKSDFVFNCTQQLTVGKINKVALGTDAKYKPNGSMIGANTPTIKVLYKNTYIDVAWDNTLNDYCFEIDLTNKQNENNIRFTVLIEDNSVLNASETTVSLPCSYESINNLSKLTELFSIGGIGRLTSNISLSADLTVTKDVYLTTTDKSITMNQHKIIVPSDITFKANNIYFNDGYNAIQQNTGSKVELTNCVFENCRGFGSVIDCQIDIDSLTNPNDFTTILKDCRIGDCSMAIVHSGYLTIDNCRVSNSIAYGKNNIYKILDKDYPYFLYQTDGNAVITNSRFELENPTNINYDIGFNPCIFVCGETAQVNGLTHTELQQNNIQSFLDTAKNTSEIDVTYKYDAINDYITLDADNCYCHGVSGVDFVFKTNVTARRV